MARPTKMTEAVLGKLEQAFAYGASDKEACFYAGINPDTMYEYQKTHPEFTERKEALKERPILDARQKVVGDIKNDVKVAQWYLERKRKKEFSIRTEVEQSGDNIVADILKAAGLTGGQDGTDNDGTIKGSSKNKT